MKIAIFTPFFTPRVGGVETVSYLLAQELSSRHQVSLLTTTEGPPCAQASFELIRRPSLRSMVSRTQKADIALSFGPSLRFIPIPLLLRKPLIINHYTWFAPNREPITAVQRALCRFATNVTPSHMLADDIGLEAKYMPNPFDVALFAPESDCARDQDIVFLGRLVAEKGLDVLLKSLNILRQRQSRRKLTVVGEGEHEAKFRALATQLGLDEQVHWAGRLQGKELARCLSRHKVMAVPSVWREPFGVVALEGLASGCQLVVADNGGLVEAAGPYAQTFAAGNEDSLANALTLASAACDTTSQNQAAVHEHLQSFSPQRVANCYETLISTLLA